jgi:small subunit ribosomal protein S3
VQLKPGMFGIRVRIMPPDTVFPDKLKILDKLPPEEELTAKVAEKGAKPEEADIDEEATEETVQEEAQQAVEAKEAEAKEDETKESETEKAEAEEPKEEEEAK